MMDDIVNYLLQRFNDYEVPISMEAKDVREYLKKFIIEYESEINRVEVINHINDKGREVIVWDDNAKIELSFQDNGKTLKIFITEK